MARYFFDISGSIRVDDQTGRHIPDSLDLRIQALAEAAGVAARESRHGKETEVVVTVRDATGAECLKVRLLSQVDVP
ncbi:DUF6894 family protein [Methylobacterium haplocladii]|uniref:DUF6894 domain-containing protein n=1 Tax=Methylobacterium haplocladii TaxID=1176176 RepID=A0A512IKJ4_9HYPH|nr:hypothetical protein [Methylobacterium haplocladii]GEO98219.1 hypothetical protein MHA02_06070 [Methylobacterium haplocladii]GJD84386.1 hypothetical protein HPGCJGGD_2262 [Methylobacterium haplocladii]GLS59997.1 hypothetical protein GCM10007887_26730 [Methylobacterium haplocladii]